MPGRNDRIEPRGRLVEEQDLRVHRQRASHRGALLHSAAQLRGHEVLEACQAHLLQLDPHHDLDGRFFKMGVLAQRQRHIFAHRHGAEKRPALKRHSHLLANLVHLVVRDLARCSRP